MTTVEELSGLQPETPVVSIQGVLLKISDPEEKGGTYPCIQQWGFLKGDSGAEFPLTVRDNIIPGTWQGQRVVFSMGTTPKGMSGVKIKEVKNPTTGEVKNKLWVTGSGKVALLGANGAPVAHRAPQPAQATRAPQAAPTPPARPQGAQEADTVEKRVAAYKRLFTTVCQEFGHDPEQVFLGLSPSDLKEITTGQAMSWKGQYGVYAPPVFGAAAPPSGTPVAEVAPPAGDQGALIVPWREFNMQSGRTLGALADAAERGDAADLYKVAAWAYRTAEDGKNLKAKDAVFAALEELGIGTMQIAEDLLLTAFKGDSEHMDRFMSVRWGKPGLAALTASQVMEVIHWSPDFELSISGFLKDQEAEEDTVPF